MFAPAGMNNKQLGVLIRKAATQIHEDQLGFWKFEVGDAIVFVITDESHNRMRIMSPVIELASVPSDTLQILLEANYDRALDARYCINNELNHDHYFEETSSGTQMCDVFSYSSPFGVLGNIANVLLVHRHLTKLLETRNQIIKQVAESGEADRILEMESA